MHRFFRQVAVGSDQHRPHGRGHGNLVSAHHRLGKMLQRNRLVIPLGKVAMNRRGILNTVIPLDAGTTLISVEEIPGKHHDRNPVAPGVVYGHRRMLQPHGTVSHHSHRLARRFGIAMRHRDRRFLVHAGEKLGFFVAAVVDDRLLKAAEARPRIRRDVLDTSGLDDIDHEIRAGSADDLVSTRRFLSSVRIGLRSLRRRVRRCHLSSDDCRRGGRGSFQKRSAIDSLFAHNHLQ